MGSDEFHKKRKRDRIKKRKKEKRFEKISLHLICEGETEVSYFGFLYPQQFTYHKLNCLDRIKSKIKELSEAHAIFVILDGDIHRNGSLLNFIKNYSKKTKTTILINTPCFEYWLLLHFCYSTRQFGGNNQKRTPDDECCQELRRQLQAHNIKYKKGRLDPNLLTLLKANQETAIQHSKTIESQSQDCISNPYSNMYLFFDNLKKIKQNICNKQTDTQLDCI